MRVVDLSRWIAGPFCTMLLGDLGADVIKVERPTGDDTRLMEPAFHGESLYFLHYNRNKRSISLNLRSQRGTEILAQLLSRADVLVENFRPGVLEEMGFDEERLRQLNPRLVVTRISGFGQGGDYSRRPMFDAIAQAMAGAMAMTGSPESGPLRAGTFAADHVAGLYAAFSTLAALRSRDQTGEGQVVDIGLLDALFSVVGVATSVYLNSGEEWSGTGNRDPFTAPANVFPTKDGTAIYIDAGTEDQFVALASIEGAPEELRSSRYATNEGRLRHVEELERVISQWTSGCPLSELALALEKAAIPYGPVNSIAQACNEDALRGRRAIVSIPTPDGTLRVPAAVPRFSKYPSSVRLRPPTLGEHTAEILTSLCGFSPGQIEELRADGAL